MLNKCYQIKRLIVKITRLTVTGFEVRQFCLFGNEDLANVSL
jgi:hypothetical protein